MTREILFRGKRMDNGEWTYGYYCPKPYSHFPCEATIFPSETIDRDWHGERVDPDTVGQFIGLCDKNGVRIFEGDIVRYGDTIHSVVFEQRNGTAYFGLIYSPFETLPFGHYQDLKQIEVLGNIHDNPELLEVGENEM